jgi:hypothetical protein
MYAIFASTDAFGALTGAGGGPKELEHGLLLGAHPVKFALW